MTGKTHQSIGLLAVSAYFFTQTTPQYGPATLATVVAASYIGSLLPDIDQPTGRLWEAIPFAGKTLGKLSDPFLEHRNITHSLLGFGLVGIGIYLLTNAFPSYWGLNNLLVFIAFMIAYASHLLADMFTEEGIPLLFPWHYSFGIPPQPFKYIRIKTGRWFENLVVFPAVNIATIILIAYNWQNFKVILFK